MAQVVLDKVTKVYPGGVKAVDGIDLGVGDREFVVLVGPSGCGKSTTLRMIAGLEEMTSGNIRIGERVVNHVPPKDRDIAMVFQNYALYPHMTVYRNMEFALKLRKVPRPQRHARVLEAAKILDIEHLLDRKPRQLSGGQRQRVAVGRAIVREPAAFLFDEPLSNLDAKLRVTTRAELKRLHQRLRTTTVYVTHDQEEAMTLGDRIVVMKDGKIQQADTPLATYNSPVNRFVAGFIGMPPMNFFDGMLRSGEGGLVFEEGKLEHAGRPGVGIDPVEVGAGRLTLPGNGFRLPVPVTLAQRLGTHAGRHVVLGVRPEHFGLQSPEDMPQGKYRLDVTVNIVEPLGSQMDVYLSTALHGSVVARVPARQGLEPGQRAAVAVDLSRAHFFEPGEAGSNLSLETAMAGGASSSSPASEPAHAIA
jgi:multiple sugar transport system ATP-binding protein